jgi:isopenicillin-N epimerase
MCLSYRALPDPPSLARYWNLDPSVVQLNHGSFGATPASVLDRQHELRTQLEADPTGFYLRDLPGLAERARTALADFIGAAPDDLAFVANATAGVNTVLRSVDLGPGDEVVMTDHEYPACRNAVQVVAAEAGARVVVVALPFPVGGPDEVLAAIAARLSRRTRLVLVDHVTSPSGLVLPLEDVVEVVHERGAAVLVDGAHAPGMIGLDVVGLGADFYTGNCHKWLCAPKGAGFLWVARPWREQVRPLAISHGATAVGDRFRHEFDWTGTDDPTARLCVPEAIDGVGGTVPGGWPEVRRRNHRLAVSARDLLCEALSVEPPVPSAMMGSMAAVPLPEAAAPPRPPFGFDPLQDELFQRFRVEVPVITWLPGPGRVLRVSAQLYNRLEQVEYLAAALAEVLGST